jgi:hypothetical protein
MKLVCIANSFPFGPAESFFTAGVRELLRQDRQLPIVPRSFRGDRTNRNAETITEQYQRVYRRLMGVSSP